MFSLIITIISIALVAALALATLYYGGAAFNKSAATADATKLISQSQQLQGAAELYKADTGAYPVSMAALVLQNYLKSIPVAAVQSAPVALMGSALAAGQPWVMVLSGYPVFALAPVTEAVCKSVNQQSYGQSGILKTARKTKLNQCYGTDVNSLIMVTSSNGAMLELVAASPSAVMALGPVTNDPIPTADSTDTSAAGWLVAPAAAAAAVPIGGLTFLDDNNVVLTNLNMAVESGLEGYADLTVKNTSSSAITFDATPFTFSAPFSPDYTDCGGVTLAPGDSCYVEVRFTPSVLQAYSSFAVPNVTAGGPVPSLALSGAGVTALAFTVSEEGVEYPFGYGRTEFTMDGFYPVAWSAARPVTRTLVATNVSGESAAMHTAWGNHDYDPSKGLTQTSTCGALVAPGGTCTITISYAPSAALYLRSTSYLILVPGPGSNTQPPLAALPVGAKPLQVSYAALGHCAGYNAVDQAAWAHLRPSFTPIQLANGTAWAYWQDYAPKCPGDVNPYPFGG